MNVAEFSPRVADAVDHYLRASVDVARRLGCEWIVVHAGYHFSSAIAARQASSLERLRRATAYAESAGAHLLLENLNREPEHAEVRYLAHTVEECRWPSARTRTSWRRATGSPGPRSLSEHRGALRLRRGAPSRPGGCGGPCRGPPRA